MSEIKKGLAILKKKIDDHMETLDKLGVVLEICDKTGYILQITYDEIGRWKERHIICSYAKEINVCKTKIMELKSRLEKLRNLN